MDEIVAALRDQQAELAALLAGLGEEGWSAPSRCEGWTVKDVALHLAQTNAMAVASATDTFSEHLAEMTQGLTFVGNVDDGAGAMVARDRGVPAEEVHRRLRTTAGEFVALVDGADLHRRVTWVAGQLSLRTLVTTRLSETWIHTGDIAAALDVDLPVTDRLQHIARLAWRTIPYAFARAGRAPAGGVAVELTGPAGTPWTFSPEGDEARTVIRGDAIDWCLVAARRVDPATTSLQGTGPDADAVLELVRTYA